MPHLTPRTAAERLARRARAELLARGQAYAVSRRQLYVLGLSRAEVRANLRARRWQRVGRHVVVVHTGPIGTRTELWAAQLSGGPRARLDGASALVAAGLTGYDVDVHRVSVPRGARTFRDRLVDVRQTRRWQADDLAPGSGPPRTRPEIAAVRAALWARTDRQAALVLTMTVQQGLVPPERIASALLAVRKAPRLSFVVAVVTDLLGGVRSLAELDFATGCRCRGLPEPTRQVLRRGAGGRYYLDVYWEAYALVVEVDGIQHLLAPEVIADGLAAQRGDDAGPHRAPPARAGTAGRCRRVLRAGRAGPRRRRVGAGRAGRLTARGSVIRSATDRCRSG